MKVIQYYFNENIQLKIEGLLNIHILHPTTLITAPSAGP